MTVPRQILPGSTYLVTRRCSERRFLLKPTDTTNEIIRYCIAVAQAATGVELHAVCAMSNHLHLVVTDSEARLPAFLQQMNRLIAACLNASYGRWENLWAAEQASVVRLEEPADVLDKIAYTLANPVSAGLVKCGRDWPGVRSAPEHVAGHTESVCRPTVFFREQGGMPQTAQLRFSAPPQLAAEPPASLAAQVVALVQERQAQAVAQVRSEGRSFLGVRAIRAQRITDTPMSAAPRRQRNPRIAAKNKWRRIEAIRRLKSFLTDYRHAFEQLQRGITDVIFPAGTYAQHVFFGARTAPS